jgi:hypothetical protein
MSHRPLTNTSSLKIAAAYCAARRAGFDLSPLSPYPTEFRTEMVATPFGKYHQTLEVITFRDQRSFFCRPFGSKKSSFRDNPV